MVGGVECREAWLVHLEANVSRETFAFGGKCADQLAFNWIGGRNLVVVKNPAG